MNILTHLKNRLHQRGLRQQLTRAKTATPILDAVAEAAKLEGVPGDEIIADFISGKYQHPIISAVLSKPAPLPAPPARPAITGAKKHEDVHTRAVREALEQTRQSEEREKREERERRQQAAPPEDLFKDTNASAIVRCINKSYYSKAEEFAARAELKRRGYEQLPNGKNWTMSGKRISSK